MVASTIERIWRVLSSQLRSVETAKGAPDPLVDLGPLSRALPDATLSDYQEKFILDGPIEGRSIGPISFGGISVAPGDAVPTTVTALHRIGGQEPMELVNNLAGHYT